MTLKTKIDALKEAASDPMSRDPTSPFQQFRQKKMDKRLEDLLDRGVPANTPQTPQADYHLTKYIQKGIKIRPPKPGRKVFNRITTAQENKDKLRQMFAEEEEHPVDQFKKLKDLDYKKGFSYDPREKKIISNEDARKKYGKPGVSMHYIAVTDNPGDAEKLRKKWDEIHSSKEAKEKPPHFIGGWQDEKGVKYTDISYILNSNDPEEVQEHLQKTNQKYTYTVHPSGKTETIANKKYKTKDAQEHETTIELEPTAQPLQVVFQGKRYAHMGKLDIGSLNYDEVDPIKDMNSISIGLINESESELTRFALETNMPKDAYKIDFPYKIGIQGKAIATLFLMGSKINKMPKDTPIRLKFTYKEKEI